MKLNTTKDRSYDVRRDLAGGLGKPFHRDFSCSVPTVFADGTTGRLTSTSNAGFRGIEGHFQMDDGSHKVGVSLGMFHVVESEELRHYSDGDSIAVSVRLVHESYA